MIEMVNSKEENGVHCACNMHEYNVLKTER